MFEPFQVLIQMSPALHVFKFFPIDDNPSPVHYLCIYLDFLPFGMCICIQIVFPFLVQRLEEQEIFGCSTSHRTHANCGYYCGNEQEMGRLVGGQVRDRKSIRREGREPQTCN